MWCLVVLLCRRTVSESAKADSYDIQWSIKGGTDIVDHRGRSCHRWSEISITSSTACQQCCPRYWSGATVYPRPAEGAAGQDGETDWWWILDQQHQVSLLCRCMYCTCIDLVNFYSASALIACNATAVLLTALSAVRPSVTCWYCVETNEATIMRFSLSVSAIILVFGDVKIVGKFAGDHPARELKSGRRLLQAKIWPIMSNNLETVQDTM